MSNKGSRKVEDGSYEYYSSEDDEKAIIPEHLKVYVTKVYTEVKTTMKEVLDKGLNSKTVLALTDACMRVTGKLKNLAGSEKKTIVLTVVGKFVEESANDLHNKMQELSANALEELNELHVMVNKMLSPYIDQVYSLAPKLYGKTKQCCSVTKCF